MNPVNAWENLVSATSFSGSTTPIFASLNRDGELDCRSLNTTTELEESFAALALEALHGLGARIERLIEHSSDYRPDQHECEWVTISGSSLEALVSQIPEAGAVALLGPDDEDFASSTRFYVLDAYIGKERIQLFRQFGRKRALHRASGLLARFAGERYDRLDEPTYQFDSSVDAVAAFGTMFIINKHAFQTIFGFYDLLRESTTASLGTIAAAVPIANVDELKASALRSTHMMAKLRNIAQKSYLQQVTTADLRRTIKQFALPVQLSGPRGREKLVFDPKQRWALLNLLDDRHVASVMTRRKYEASSKRELETK